MLAASSLRASFRRSLLAGSSRPTACLFGSERWSSTIAEGNNASEHGRKKKPIIITTPIFYVNAAPHVGHLFSALLADSLARWFRIKGEDVIFSTGTDEHGQKVYEAAEKAGMDPAEFTDKVSKTFSTLFDQANISYTDFIRTSEPRHKKAVQHFWNELAKREKIYLGQYRGWYCKSDESFLSMGRVNVILDKDGVPKAISKESGHEATEVNEENYKFNTKDMAVTVLEWMTKDPEAVYPDLHKNQVRLLLADPSNLSISRLRRPESWGISVPGDENHIVYVWFDALINYLTATGYPWTSSEEGEEISNKSVPWPPDYQALSEPSNQIIGKDIIKFHCLYWPAFLAAAELDLPRRVVAHPHWTVGKVKMSKSLGNVIDPRDVMAKYGVEATRYYLLKEARLRDDKNFCYEELVKVVNSDLKGKLGNLVARCSGPAILPSQTIPQPGPLTPEDQELVDRIHDTVRRVGELYEKPEPGYAVEEVMTLVDAGNAYFHAQSAWELTPKKDDPEPDAAKAERLGTVLYNCLELSRIAGCLLYPVVPEASTKIRRYLGADSGPITLQRYGEGRPGVSLVPQGEGSFKLQERLKSPTETKPAEGQPMNRRERKKLGKAGRKQANEERMLMDK